MSILLIIVDGSKKFNYKATPMTVLSDVMSASLKHFKRSGGILKQAGKELDLSLTVRFAGLSNRSKLELVSLKKIAAPSSSVSSSSSSPSLSAHSAASSSLIRIAVQKAGGRRATSSCSPQTSLWSVLEQMSLLESGSAAIPVLTYVGQRFAGQELLNRKSLKSIGLQPGTSALFRFDYEEVKIAVEQVEQKKEEVRRTKKQAPLDSSAEPKSVTESSSTISSVNPPSSESIDRRMTVILPGMLSSGADWEVELPSQFFKLTTEDLKNEVASMRSRRTEEERDRSILKTRAMREREAEVKRPKFNRTTLRVRFPDGLFLQGTFSPKQSVSDLRDFIDSLLADHCAGHPYKLFIGPPRQCLNDENASFDSLHLVPNARINLVFSEPAPSPTFLQRSLLEAAKATMPEMEAAKNSKKEALVAAATSTSKSKSETQASSRGMNSSDDNDDSESDSRGSKRKPEKKFEAPASTKLKVPKWLKLHK